jgi:hypothetical protein
MASGQGVVEHYTSACASVPGSSRACATSTTCTVPLCNSKLCDLGSLTLGKYCTFVCGILFRRIKLIELFTPKQNSTYKSMTV